LHSFDAIVLF